MFIPPPNPQVGQAAGSIAGGLLGGTDREWTTPQGWAIVNLSEEQIEQALINQIFISGSGQIATELADATISGSLTLTGKLTAQEFHTEFTSASIIFSSGSNKFGDDLTDKHEFTGSIIASSSLQVTGSISTSGSVTAESFSGIFSGAVSSSAQLATAISGSFTSVS